MDLKLEILVSSRIKRKKPWPRFRWLGLERESLFILDDNRISEINIVSGHCKKTQKLHLLLPRIVTMEASQNGMWLAGLLSSGDLFLWCRDTNCVKTVTTVPTLSEMVILTRGLSVRISLLVSDNGQRVLIITLTGRIFLWECVKASALQSSRDGMVEGRWAEIMAPENALLPSAQDKEACQHGAFIRSQVLGDCCLCVFVFTSGEQLSITCLKIFWDEVPETGLRFLGYRIQWTSRLCPLSELSPPCQPVKSRGALVLAVSSDGLLLAVAVNQRDPNATQVLFVSTQKLVSVSCGVGCCGSRRMAIPRKYVRSFWVGSMNWAPTGLYLACVLKRGSLLMMTTMGLLLSLSTTGCGLEFDHVHYLPLHPLVRIRPTTPSQKDGSMSSSCASVQDVMRQRYSVTWHPRLLYLIVSDGYNATVVRVLGESSPATLIEVLLLGAMERLLRMHKNLAKTLPHVMESLEGMPFLKTMASVREPKAKTSTCSTLPPFLQQERDALPQPAEVAGDDSDYESFANPCLQDRGRLDSSAMFDTLHALPDLHQGSVEEDMAQDESLLSDLKWVERSLLTAWALVVSLGDRVEHRRHLLDYTINCTLRYTTLLLVAPQTSSFDSSGCCVPQLLQLFKTLMSLLQWDLPQLSGTSCLGAAVDLTKQMVAILLSTQHDVSIQSLLAAMVVLQIASSTLDCTYGLLQGSRHVPNVHQGGQTQILICDVFNAPLPKSDTRCRLADASFPKPSSRLLTVWWELYQTVLKCHSGLRCYKRQVMSTVEYGKISRILHQVQATLQQAGVNLGTGPMLHEITGEWQYLFGMYAESAHVWALELWEQQERDMPRTAFLQTRYCLALLFGHLSQYRLREAQGFCDSLARHLLLQAGMEVKEQGQSQGNGQSSPVWMPINVTTEAAFAVVQTLGRFMVSHFTHQLLAIMPPHNVDVLLPLHVPSVSRCRLVPLSQRRVSEAVQMQKLSGLWTPGYALDLLLIGGMFPEASWFAKNLGDWKVAALLSVAFSSYCRKNSFSAVRRKQRELSLPAVLQPVCLFQEQLEGLLGTKDFKSMYNPEIINENYEFLHASVQDLLRAAAMARLDVLSMPLHLLTNHTRKLVSSLPVFVPSGIHLPTPPLYCPQLAIDKEDLEEGAELALERISRQHVSCSLQRAWLLLRASCCLQSSAQWYTAQLYHCHQLLTKQNCPSRGTDKPFPDWMMKFITYKGFFRPGLYGKQLKDSVTIETITCFRELCGLSWMLHARDQLSLYCRRYQSARVNGKEEEVVSCCMDAVLWACRLLPFSRFLNAEETLQDLLLSLVSELSHLPVVTDILTQVFPEENLVVVPLREKYSSLLHMLQDCCLQDQEPEKGKINALIRERLLHRKLDPGNIANNIVTLEQHIWEQEENGASAMECREPILNSMDAACNGNNSHKASQVEHGNRKSLCGLPSVGTWEFELEDDEYLKFLDLLLSYLVEKRNGINMHKEPPLLKSYSLLLQKRELNSLAFSVVSTLKRRQHDSCRPSPAAQNGLTVFRPGQCYQIDPGLCGPQQQTHSAFPGSELYPSHDYSRSIHVVEQWAFKPLQATEHLDLQRDIDSKLEAQFPKLGRLMEWMVRWSDWRSLPHHAGNTQESTAGKVSAPAVLNALQLLDYNCRVPHSKKLNNHSRRHPGATTVTKQELVSKKKREKVIYTDHCTLVATPLTTSEMHQHAPSLCSQNVAEPDEKHDTKQDIIGEEVDQTHMKTAEIQKPASEIEGIDPFIAKEGGRIEEDVTPSTAVSVPAIGISVHTQTVSITTPPQDQTLTAQDCQIICSAGPKQAGLEDSLQLIIIKDIPPGPHPAATICSEEAGKITDEQPSLEELTFKGIEKTYSEISQNSHSELKGQASFLEDVEEITPLSADAPLPRASVLHDQASTPSSDNFAKAYHDKHPQEDSKLSVTSKLRLLHLTPSTSLDEPPIPSEAWGELTPLPVLKFPHLDQYNFSFPDYVAVLPKLSGRTDNFCDVSSFHTNFLQYKKSPAVTLDFPAIQHKLPLLRLPSSPYQMLYFPSTLSTVGFAIQSLEQEPKPLKESDFPARTQPPVPRLIPLEKFHLTSPGTQIITPAKHTQMTEENFNSRKRQKWRELKKTDVRKIGTTIIPVEPSYVESKVKEPALQTTSEECLVPYAASLCTFADKSTNVNFNASPPHGVMSAKQVYKEVELQNITQDMQQENIRSPSPLQQENIRSPNPVETRSSGSPAKDTDKDGAGQSFLNVIDLQSRIFHQNLPTCQPQLVQDRSSSLLTSVQTQVFTTPSNYLVVEELPVPPSMDSETHLTENAKKQQMIIGQQQNRIQTELQETVRVNVKNDMGANFTLQEEVEQTKGPVDKKLLCRNKVSAGLSEMEDHLSAMQSIADQMDLEIANTRMLSKTIDTMSPLTFDQGFEDASFTIRSNDNGPSEEEPEHSGVSSNSHRCSVDSLDFSGLTDVADIIRELKPNSGISGSAVDLSQLETSFSNGYEEEQQAFLKYKNEQTLQAYHLHMKDKHEHDDFPYIANNRPACIHRVMNKKQTKDRMTLQEHQAQRTHDACALMAELLTVPLDLTETSPSVSKAYQRDSGNRQRPEMKKQRKMYSSAGLRPNAKPGPRHSTSSPVLKAKDLETTQSWLGPYREDKGLSEVIQHRMHNTLEVKTPNRDSVEFERLSIKSESTGSIISKLDWAAIEKLVAGEDESD